jgi:hypothetical protein
MILNPIFYFLNSLKNDFEPDLSPTPPSPQHLILTAITLRSTSFQHHREDAAQPPPPTQREP